MLASLAVVSCSFADSSVTPERARLGHSQARLSVASANYEVQGTFWSRHETATAYTPGFGGQAGKWVVAWNGPFAGTMLEWAVSADTNGTSWQTYSMANSLSFGDPGPSPYGKSAVQSGVTRPFRGWEGDPAIAMDSNPATNNYYRRVYVANMAEITYPDDSSTADEIVVAYSDDQGRTWGHAHYLTTGDDNGTTSMPVSGGGVDLPKIASNPVSPYHTFGTWAAPGKTWLRKFSYDAAGNFSG